VKSFGAFIRRLGAFGILGLMGACGGGEDSPTQSQVPTRSYRMGFSAIPPRVDQESVLANLELWTPRADAAIAHFEVPYKALLAGSTAEAHIRAEHLPLAQYYRTKGLPLWVTFDCTNGIDRAAESTELTDLDRSITEPAIQALFRDYVKTYVSIIQPQQVGLGAETNLIRAIAPAQVYTALVTMVNATAADLQALYPSLPLYVTVQADIAWGRSSGTNTYLGVEQDFTDFPFITTLGISSYPYLAGFTRASQIPLDYYQRLRGGRAIPVFVAEGGWTSASLDAGTVQIVSSPAIQAEYLTRQHQLLEAAQGVAYFQLTFTDLDLSGYPAQPEGSILPLFTRNGLVDAELNAKPALAIWDDLFARSRK